jgi:ubiquinone/menaquinone biosynthesis C-methylase UbiE
MSLDFDRAASYYDDTRGLEPAVANLMIEALVRETRLLPEARVLEIGIGTGRIAIPLSAQVSRITGVDLSLQMMRLLRAKAADIPRKIDLARADAVRLPLRGDWFDLAYGVHVLHLVSGWRSALAEAKRVLKPHGFFAANWHRRAPDSPNAVLRRELSRLVEESGINTRRPGAQSEAEILEELETWHDEMRVVNVADWNEPSTPARIIAELDRQIYSETWQIPRQVMDAVIPRLRGWAQSEFGSLEQEISSPYNFRWLIARNS